MGRVGHWSAGAPFIAPSPVLAKTCNICINRLEPGACEATEGATLDGGVVDVFAGTPGGACPGRYCGPSPPPPCVPDPARVLGVPGPGLGQFGCPRNEFPQSAATCEPEMASRARGALFWVLAFDEFEVALGCEPRAMGFGTMCGIAPAAFGELGAALGATGRCCGTGEVAAACRVGCQAMHGPLFPFHCVQVSLEGSYAKCLEVLRPDPFDPSKFLFGEDRFAVPVP